MALGLVRDPFDLLDQPDNLCFHTLAPFVAYALLEAKDLGNGWELFDTRWFGAGDPAEEPVWGCADLEKHMVMVRRQAESTSRDEIYVLTSPDLSVAEQVIGLDGTPRKVMWEAIFNEDFTIERLIPDDQMEQYVQQVQDITIERAGGGTKPYGSGTNVAVDFDTAVTHVGPHRARRSSVCHAEEGGRGFPAGGNGSI